MNNRKPVHEIREGSVTATIWLNREGTEAFHSVTFSRLYRDGDAWRQSHSFSYRKPGAAPASAPGGAGVDGPAGDQQMNTAGRSSRPAFSRRRQPSRSRPRKRRPEARLENCRRTATQPQVTAGRPEGLPRCAA